VSLSLILFLTLDTPFLLFFIFILKTGEYDAMAVHQMTGLPAVSLPNGAGSLPIEILPRLEKFKKIYLWMDDDGKLYLVVMFIGCLLFV